MDLKFTFGASNPLPLAEGAGSSLPGTSSGSSQQLELHVTVEPDAAGGPEGTDGASGTAKVVCEARSGDGVSYAQSEKIVADHDPETLAAAVRSVLARTGATLPEPLLPEVSCLVMALGGAEAAAIVALGLPVEAGQDRHAPVSAVDAALQARTGITAGTPIRIES